MSSPDPITRWMNQLIAGDRTAVQPLWEAFYRRLIALAQQRLRGMPQRMADREDVALSAFASFCRAAEQGRLPQLIDRDSLWSHLFIYTLRKAHSLLKRERAQKRGGGKVLNEAALEGAGGEPGLIEVLGREPTPEMAAVVAEEYRRLLDRLPDAELRSVAQWKLEGYTNDEIAAKFGCVRRTVERMLHLIRGHWENGGGHERTGRAEPGVVAPGSWTAYPRRLPPL
jgi:DNA-directed RNA polymerase specialized sigma24 family protein